jgi:2-keto-4-pentenoate hydratase/2-oxohepta-3-ene-1,7-dioic acid hydratase in catechol pathway
LGYKIIRFKQREKIQWGIVKNDKIYPVVGDYLLLADFIKHGLSHAQALAKNCKGESLDLHGIKILNPVTAPCQIVCQGKNYRDHRIETGASPDRPDFNLLFSKGSSSLAPPKGQVICPSHVKLLDYELELGLVIGRNIHGPQKITQANLIDFVCGIVMANDISARDIQIPQGQWFKGKSFRTFCPTGPYLYVLDSSDIERLSDLQLTLKVNGEIRQNGNTRELLFGPAETLEEISQIMDLWAGDLILTGTPGGVALKVPSEHSQAMNAMPSPDRNRMDLFIKSQLEFPRYLKNGDVVESMIRSGDGAIDLGIQRFTIAKADLTS